MNLCFKGLRSCGRSTVFVISSEDLLAIWQQPDSGVDSVRPILCQEAFDCQLIASLQRVFSPALPVQAVGCAAFDSIIHGLATGVGGINVDVDVRIHPLYLCDLAGELDRFVVVVLGSERVMCEERNCYGQYQDNAETTDA